MRDESVLQANVTIRDVARRAAVSVGTVSRVLNRATNVDEALKLRVMSAVVDLGFQPDPAAQALRSRSSHVIGVVLPDITNPLTSAAVIGIEPVLARAGYTLFLASSHSDRVRETEIIEQFRRRRVDGIIAMVGCDTDPGTHKQLSDLSFPFVLLEREMDIEADAVRTNQFEGTYRATRYLIGLGHRRIGLITVPPTTLSGRERLRGFKTAFEHVGIESPDDLVHSGGRERPYARDAAYAALTGVSPPTALIASGGHLGGAIEAIRLLNLKIPQHLSLVTLGDTELAALMEPPITAIRYDWAATGRCAAELVISRLSGVASGKPQRIVVPHEFVIRGSCAPRNEA